MNRIFQKPDIEEICTNAKQAITDTKDCIDDIRSTAAAITAAAATIPAEAKTGDIGGTASALPGKLQKDNYDITKEKLEACHEKACTIIPTYDSRYAERMKDLTDAARKIKTVIEDLQQFMLETPLTTPAETFEKLLEAKQVQWRKTLDKVDAALEEALANAKGAEKISTIFSKDPVNLSTGNFIYDKTDLEINGTPPFAFRRFYNSRNTYAGTLGADWNHNYELHLTFQESDTLGEDEITIFLADGKEEHFLPVDKTRYTPGNQSLSVLTKTEEGYAYTNLSGDTCFFDREGRYLRQENANGQGWNLTYEDGRPVCIEKDTGEFFTLFYDENGYLKNVTDHTGRTVTYEIKDGRLRHAVCPDGGDSAYEYDGSGKLISVINPRGITTVENTYDENHRTTLQKFPDGTQMTYEYDDEKNTVTLTERNGAKTIHVHDDKYRNIKNIYPDGEETFTYNSRNQKTKITDKLGNETRLSYDNRGNLTGITNPLGTKLSITYESHNRPTNIKINGKEKQKNTFDGRGNLLEVENALGNKYTFMNNKTGMPTVIVQPDKSKITITYDRKGNITEYVDARGGITRYVYDDLNRIVKVTDPNGNETGFSYDQAGNIQTITNSVGDVRTYEYNKSNKVIKIIDFDGSVLQRTYNVLDKPEMIIDQLGRATKLQYDAMWNLARVIAPNGAKTTYFYNENNHLSRVKDALGNVKRFTYDGNGNRISETDENGNVTRFAYDSWGRLICAKRPDGAQYHYVYDAEGNLTEAEDALGGRISMEYDEAGQLIRETNQIGESRSYTYNSMGKLESVTDETDRKTVYEYLPGGLLETVIYPEGTMEKYTYDKNGNIETYTNRDGFVLTYQYNSLNQVIGIEGSNGEKKTYAYDAVGNMISMTDDLGNITGYEYTLTGKLSKVIDPLNHEIEYIYDECDNLLEIRQYGEEYQKDKRECHITRYERDLLGNIETVIDPLGLKEHYKYDPKGQLLEKIDKEGYLTQYNYTAQGDIKHIKYADGREVKLSYNVLRQLQEIQDWLGTTKIETDILGRAVKVLYPDNEEVIYTYGKAGKRTSVTYPNGKEVFYNYDKNFRLSELKADDKVIRYDYDNRGRIIKKSFPNQMETIYRYDGKGQIEQLIHMDREGILDKFTYQYDFLGNKTAIMKERRGMSEESGEYVYDYDPIGRIAGVTKNGTILRTYTYDAFGNRTGLTEGEKETRYTYNALNQPVLKIDSNGETKYSFDKRGNLTQILENGSVKNQYFYGAMNRLEQAVNQRGEMAQYQYNGMGYRIGKEVDRKKPIRYTVDMTRQYYNLLQKEEAGNIQMYLWDVNVAGLIDDSRDCADFYFQDEMGSPVRLADAEGDLIETYGYNEFGQELYRDSVSMQPFGYTGYQYDEIAEVYYAQAREYDCRDGRFCSVDPYKGTIYKGDTINNYIYCINNPLAYIDPLGLMPAWLEGIFAHIQIEAELHYRQFPCESTRSNVRIPGAGLGVTGTGYADFVIDKGPHVEIYEIKPGTWSTGYQNKLAVAQLKRYVNNYYNTYKKVAYRGTQVFGDSIPYCMDPSRTLTYWSGGDGLIYYSISPKPEPEPEPESLPAVVPEYEMKQKKDFNPVIIGTCILAGIYTVGTIVEDVATGGAGIADDVTIPMAWAWALSF